MTVKTRPLAEITEEALTLLYWELGATDTVRFLNQYGAGCGDYTKEREALFADLTLDEIVRQIKRGDSSVPKRSVNG